MENYKPFYLSKTILMNMLMGLAMIVGVFYPPAAEFIKEYFSEMGIGWAFVNVILRLVTSKEIS